VNQVDYEVNVSDAIYKVAMLAGVSAGQVARELDLVPPDFELETVEAWLARR
jgi:hypothetical protein